jgi:tetratricopeptide (TPR) repeat protein
LDVTILERIALKVKIFSAEEISYMTIERHNRIPAIAIILTACVSCLVLGFIFTDDTKVDFDKLERTVAKTDDSKVWMQYAQALESRNRYQHAAQAYRKVLQIEPYNNQARYQCALALARSDDEDAYFQYMQNLVLTYPQMATELFAQPECQRFLTQNRFRVLAREARVQAFD